MSFDVRVQVITPEMAEKILRECPYSHQRNVRPMLVERYASDMRKEKWNPGTVISLAECDGQTVLIDGQHRLHAVVQSGTEQTFILKTETLPNMEEAARRYYTTDTGGARTFKEAINATELSEKFGLTAKEINLVKAAAVLIDKGFRRTGGSMNRIYSPDDALVFVENWRQDAIAFFRCLEDGQLSITRRMRTAPVTAVALITFHYQCTEAREFWTQAARNDGLKRGMPAKALVDLMMEYGVRKAGQDALSRRTAFAWNAFFERESLNVSRLYRPNAPIEIAGTPYKYGRTTDAVVIHF